MYISKVEFRSYTVPGAAWIYPPLSGLLFGRLFHTGGYAAVSWLCEAALLVTVLIAAWGSEPTVLVLLLVAMPALARQMIPRSGLFTVVLAAAFARLLLDHLRGRRPSLWLLPTRVGALGDLSFGPFYQRQSVCLHQLTRRTREQKWPGSAICGPKF